MTQALDVEQLLKSRHRVKSYGEVFTPRHMVNQMLDLVSDLETSPDFVDKTFLEPAAGGGNFLVAILQRKFRTIEALLEPDAWPEESLFALASIYGVELLEDNHQDAKDAMLTAFLNFHTAHSVPCDPESDLRRAATFLVDTNIVRGNTLTGLDWRDEQIEFSWWHRVPDVPNMVHREPFTFASLRAAGMFDFTVYDTYTPCRIDQVHQQARLGA